MDEKVPDLIKCPELFAVRCRIRKTHASEEKYFWRTSDRKAVWSRESIKRTFVGAQREKRTSHPQLFPAESSVPFEIVTRASHGTGS